MLEQEEEEQEEEQQEPEGLEDVAASAAIPEPAAVPAKASSKPGAPTLWRRASACHEIRPTERARDRAC